MNRTLILSLLLILGLFVLPATADELSCKEEVSRLEARIIELETKLASCVTPDSVAVTKCQPPPSESFSRVLSQLRSVPYLKNGKPAGMRISGVKADTFWHNCGFRDGDILKQIGEFPITDNERFLKGLGLLLRETGSHRVLVDRGGVVVELPQQ